MTLRTKHFLGEDAMKIGIRKPSLKKKIAARTSPKRIIRSKVRAPKGAGWITNPKKAAYNRAYNRTTKKACYIATAVYCDPDAWQVGKLRSYGDATLMNCLAGRAFVRLYYAVSPHLVFLFKDIKPLNLAVRHLLDHVVELI